jgi:EAL domain-containing protein (putative c-di-GMP-specific phosphodiesterase class I)
VTIADRLGVKVVAVGVESLEQRDLLTSMGVREAQGFLYLGPQPAAAFAGWLFEQRRTAEAAGLA